jgi:excisionase family DNA binding protein
VLSGPGWDGPTITQSQAILGGMRVVSRFLWRDAVPQTNRRNRRERRQPELIGLSEAAERCNVHYRTIRRWIAAGDLDAVRVGKRLLKVDAAKLDALMQPVGGGAA